MEEALHRTPEVVSTTRRTGRAELDEHAAGVNMSEIEVVTRPLDRPHTAVMEEVRQNMAQIPGVVSEVGQPISHRIDHLLSGTRAQIAIKLFGPDLVTLRNKAEEIRKRWRQFPGSSICWWNRRPEFRRSRSIWIAGQRQRLGLRAEQLAETVDVAFNGEAVSQVLEDQRTYDLVVRFNDASRQSVETIASTLDRYAHRSQGADRVRWRRSVSIRGRIRSIARMFSGGSSFRPMSRTGISVPSSMKSGRRSLGMCHCPKATSCSTAASSKLRKRRPARSRSCRSSRLAGIFLLLYLALGSGRLALLVMANLPLALIGGVIMVFASGGTLSIASLIGFITLFGIATRNGIMLITHYQHLIQEEGVPFRQAIVQGSMERLSPILMTALVTGVGLIPLALGVGQPGKEIQQPMAVVILGGIVTSTFLNMIVIPALYLKYGRAGVSEKVEVRGGETQPLGE